MKRTTSPRSLFVLLMLCINLNTASAAEVGEAAITTGATSAGTDVVTVRAADTTSGETVEGVIRVTIPGMTPWVIAGDLGHVTWVREGNLVTGTILAPNGSVTTTVVGEISGSQMGGSFSDAGGVEGTWEWVGSLPSVAVQQ